MRSTADWDGRVDEFEVVEGKLMLAESEVHLVEGLEDWVPPGGSRVDQRSRAWGQVSDQNGSREEIVEDHQVFFRFPDIQIMYTGWITAGRNLNFDYYFHGGYQRANRYENRIIMKFRRGRLVEGSVRFEQGASSDRFVEVQKRLASDLWDRIEGRGKDEPEVD